MMNQRKTKQKQRKPKGKARGGIPISMTRVPAATNARVLPRPADIRSSRGITNIKGHEEIATVNGSVTFSSSKYAVNPALAVYTWLSSQAKGWEKYRFRALEFVYVPAEAVTTTKGSVYLAVDYDPSDGPPPTLASLSTYETQSAGRVYEPLRIRAKPNRMFSGIQTKKMRLGPVSGDLSLFDACSVSISTISCADTSAIGQLWVYYDVDLISRQTEPSTIIPSACVVKTLSSDQTFTTTVGAPLDFDTDVSAGFDVTDSSGVYTVPPGAYEIQGHFSAKDTSAETLTVAVQLYQNSSVVTAQAAVSKYSVVAGGEMVIPFNFFIQSSSEQTFQIQVTMTGAAGTLTVEANQSVLFIKAC